MCNVRAARRNLPEVRVPGASQDVNARATMLTMALGILENPQSACLGQRQNGDQSRDSSAHPTHL